jgi:hypothetical protein
MQILVSIHLSCLADLVNGDEEGRSQAVACALESNARNAEHDADRIGACPT